MPLGTPIGTDVDVIDPDNAPEDPAPANSGIGAWLPMPTDDPVLNKIKKLPGFYMRPGYMGPANIDWSGIKFTIDKKKPGKRQVSTNGRDWVDYDRLLDADDFELYAHRREV